MSQRGLAQPTPRERGAGTDNETMYIVQDQKHKISFKTRCTFYYISEFSQ